VSTAVSWPEPLGQPQTLLPFLVTHVVVVVGALVVVVVAGAEVVVVVGAAVVVVGAGAVVVVDEPVLEPPAIELPVEVNLELAESPTVRTPTSAIRATRAMTRTYWVLLAPRSSRSV